MIISGNSSINKVYYSGYTISKIYACGGSLVWSDTPTPPVGDKYTVRYIGGIEDSSECDEYTTLYNINFTYGKPYETSAMTEATIGDCITALGGNCFNNFISLETVSLPDTLTTIGNTCFNNCSGLTRMNSDVDGVLNIPSGVTSIGNNALQNLYSIDNTINIPDSVQSIGGNVFLGSNATSVNIGSGVTSIGQQFLNNNYNLTAITIDAITPPTLGDGCFANTNNCPIYVPCQSVSAYRAANNWKAFVSRLQPKDGSCGNMFNAKMTYKGVSGDTNIIVNSPINLNDLYVDAGYPIGFEEVPHGNVNPVSYTFKQTSNNVSAFTSFNTNSIGASMFSGTPLSSIVFDDGLVYGQSDVLVCDYLTSADFPSSFSSTSWSFIHDCPLLTSVTLRYEGDKPVILFGTPLENCPRLQTIFVPSSMVDKYKAHTYWGTYSDKFRVIP